MKTLKKSERIEIIKVFEKVIEKLTKDRKLCSLFICNAINRVERINYTTKNTLVMKYFLSQRPTNRINKHFFKGCYTGHAWWNSGEFKIRIKFLKHLIQKLSF